MSRSRRPRRRMCPASCAYCQKLKLKAALKSIAQRDLKPENWPEPRSFWWCVELSDYEDTIQNESDLQAEWDRFVASARSAA